MKNIHIADVEWQTVTGQMNADLYRKTITMERHRFGLGEYKYFRYALPDLTPLLGSSLN